MTIDDITVYNGKGELRVIDRKNKKEPIYARRVLYNLI